MKSSIFIIALNELNMDLIHSFCDQGFSEGLRIEYKAIFPDNLKLAETICAFANTQGGIILVGVEADTTKNVPKAVPGVELKKGLEEKVVNLCLSHISPSITPEVKVCDFKSNPEEPTTDRAVLFIRVQSSYNPPHYLLNNNKIPVRVLNRNSLADLSTIERLLKKRETMTSSDSLSYAFYDTKEIEIENVSYQTVVVRPQFERDSIINFYTKESSDWLFRKAQEVMPLNEQKPDLWQLTLVNLNQDRQITRYCSIRKMGDLSFQRTLDIRENIFNPLFSLELLTRVLKTAKNIYSHYGFFGDLVVGLTLVFAKNPTLIHPNNFNERYEFKSNKIKVSRLLRFDELSNPQKIIEEFLTELCVHFGLILSKQTIINLIEKLVYETE